MKKFALLLILLTLIGAATAAEHATGVSLPVNAEMAAAAATPGLLWQSLSDGTTRSRLVCVPNAPCNPNNNWSCGFNGYCSDGNGDSHVCVCL